ncbi:hypothetical protein MMC17_008324 [Xylographa soralifera]|nr:hypothetical protein [Xylographa soralifera]
MDDKIDLTPPISSEVVEPPWHEAYPAPRTLSLNVISREELLKKLHDSRGIEASKSFVLVDLRRNDHKGGMIRGSINIPAQTLYPAIPFLYGLFVAAKIDKTPVVVLLKSGKQIIVKDGSVSHEAEILPAEYFVPALD